MMADPDGISVQRGAQRSLGVERPRAIFFDLDETLIRHSEPVMMQLQAIWGRYLPAASAESRAVFDSVLVSKATELWSRISEVRGHGERFFKEMFAAALHSAGCDTGLAASMLDSFLEGVRKCSRPAPGAVNTLDRLAAAGIATGIITNGFTFLQTHKARVNGVLERVRVMVTSEDAGAHKPDPRIFQMALHHLDIHAKDAWHVGDNLSKDVIGADAAGLTSILYDPDRQHAAEQSGPAPRHVLGCLTDLPDLASSGA